MLKKAGGVAAMVPAYRSSIFPFDRERMTECACSFQFLRGRWHGVVVVVVVVVEAVAVIETERSCASAALSVDGRFGSSLPLPDTRPR